MSKTCMNKFGRTLLGENHFRFNTIALLESTELYRNHKFGLRKNEKEHQVLNKESDVATTKGKTIKQTIDGLKHLAIFESSEVHFPKCEDSS